MIDASAGLLALGGFEVDCSASDGVLKQAACTQEVYFLRKCGFARVGVFRLPIGGRLGEEELIAEQSTAEDVPNDTYLLRRKT